MLLVGTLSTKPSSTLNKRYPIVKKEKASEISDAFFIAQSDALKAAIQSIKTKGYNAN